MVTVYEPLPYMNALPQVTSVSNVNQPSLQNLWMAGGFSNWQNVDMGMKSKFEAYQPLVENFSNT